jgi:hypothetical protein
MLALKVEIDGDPVIVAGVEDWSVLAVHINGSRRDATAPVVSARTDDMKYSVGGLTQPDSSGVCHHFRWKDRTLTVGPKVSVTVVDIYAAGPPVKRYRSDAEAQENACTDEEWRQLRYQDYLELKKEFEGSESPTNASLRGCE